MNKIGLFVDGGTKLPKCPHYIEEWQQCKNIEDFKNALENIYEQYTELPVLISFSHDITDDHMFLELRRPKGMDIAYEMYKGDTGLHLAKLLCNFAQEKNLVLNKICVHGTNSLGNKNILEIINSYNKMTATFLENPAFEMNWNLN